MMRPIVLLCVLLAPTLAGASNIICPPAVSTDAPIYREGVDPSRLPVGCSLIPEAQTGAQRMLWQTTGQKRYLEVVGPAPDGLLAVKDGAGQAAVDVVLAAEQVAAQEVTDTLTDPLCEGDKTAIVTALDNLHTAQRTVLTNATTQAEMKQALLDNEDREDTFRRKVVKCLLIRTGGFR